MTAPTQYNGKPIPPGTWLAHAAEVADRDGVESLLGSADDELRQARAAGMIALQQSEAERERADVAESALAAVTDERDQALEALAATNKLGAFETGKTIGAAEVRKELAQARQMLADAPHAIQPPGCDYEATKTADPPLPCSCWKAGL